MPGPDNNGVEPMQVDMMMMGGEENDNVADNGFIIENPSLDLESYINNYTGLAKLFRLIHIADHCPPLRVDALKMAIQHVMTSYNVGMYQSLHKKLKEALTSSAQQHPSSLPDIAGGGASSNNNNNNNGPGGSGSGGGGGSGSLESYGIDQAWIEQKSKKAATILEKLDADLKNYKSNSIKESIRRGHDDLAEHYLDSGDLQNALKCFSRARDYCTSAKHVVNMCINVIKVSVYLQNWAHVLNFVAKAESTPDVMDQGKGTTKESLQIVTKLKCAAGLADLAQKKYKSAAKFFLEANFDHCDFSDMLSPNNVAVYGGICALASFDREELRKHVISSSSFKLFLELEPSIRDVIFKFYESKYGACLRLLNEMRDNLLLDMYLAPHVRALYGQIRNRGLIQYFSPYASADLVRMADCFNTSVADLENELMGLILEGQIEARIDSHNKILFAKKVDQRSVTFEKSLKTGEEYERRTKLMILRTAMLKAHIQVKSPLPLREGGGGTSDAPGNSNCRLPRE